MSIEKRRKLHKCIAAREGILVSSKADALMDGVGTLLDIFPDPRHRTIRAFVRGWKSPRSVMEAIEMDWAAVGHDMWEAMRLHECEAIRAHEHEATEENPATTSNVATR